MIVKIERPFLDGSDNELDDKVFELCEMIKFGHYLDVDRVIEDDFIETIKKHARERHWTLILMAMQKFDKEKSIRFFLTTNNFTQYSKEERKALFLTPSELLVENAPNEWCIYCNIIKYYTNGRKFNNVAKYLNYAIKNGMIKSENLGGVTMIPSMLVHKNKTEFNNLYINKVCVLFDRDKDNETDIDENKKKVFEALCNGIPFDKVTNDLVYRLDFQGNYVWHMWYKRAIENYFPKENYEQLGVDMDSFKNNLPLDYQKFDDKKKTPRGYTKDMMQVISNGLSCDYFEKHTKHFCINGDDMSEIMLLLLKIAKIV